MKIVGIDLGSRSVKIVLFEDNKITFNKVLDTALFYREYCKSIDGRINIDFDKLELGGIERIVGTGYGRNNVNIINAKIIVELKAHTLGAMWQTGLKDFILLDIGGQDSKVISVKNCKMIDMILNDKCAASCGRYLENMSTVLGISIDTLEKYYEAPVELSSTCAVFGESELIGRISEGYPLEQLAAGVNYSLFLRIKPMLERFKSETLVMAGGVAGNEALMYFIKNETCFKEVIVVEKSQLNGAIGCCVYGMNS